MPIYLQKGKIRCRNAFRAVLPLESVSDPSSCDFFIYIDIYEGPLWFDTQIILVWVQLVDSKTTNTAEQISYQAPLKAPKTSKKGSSMELNDWYRGGGNPGTASRVHGFGQCDAVHISIEPYDTWWGRALSDFSICHYLGVKRLNMIT
jgi:hypothetical protein